MRLEERFRGGAGGTVKWRTPAPRVVDALSRGGVEHAPLGTDRRGQPLRFGLGVGQALDQRCGVMMPDFSHLGGSIDRDLIKGVIGDAIRPN